jgi:hypothetical protein
VLSTPEMSESTSIASSSASVAASSTTSLSDTVPEIEYVANGSVSDPNASKAAAAMQVQQKYIDERTKRLRSDGTSQYIDLSRSDKFKHFQDDPWIDPNAPEVGVPALTDGSSCKFLILGAGYGGLVIAIRLIQAGINVDDIRIVDSAGGFGGTWYVFLPV